VVKWSGFKERAMLASVGDMDKDYQYVIGADHKNSQENQYKKSERMSAYGMNLLERNWNNHQQQLDQLGLTPAQVEGK
jgi:hypothetical protein